MTVTQKKSKVSDLTHFFSTCHKSWGRVVYIGMKSLLIAISLLLLFQVETSVAATINQANTLSIKDFLTRAKEASPDVKIEKSLADETVARAEGVRISPPMVGLMNMRDSAGTNKGFEITQELPFPTKIAKEKEVRNLEAQSQNSLYTFRKNEILLAARAAYFEFWQAFENKKILLEKKAWLREHIKISRTTARADSTSQIHLLGTESEADLLENEVLAAEVDLSEKANALKLYVPDLTTENLSPEAEPQLESVEVDKKEKSNFVIWKEDELKAADAAKSLKKQAYLPDFVLRYRSYDGNQTTPRNEEVMVGITLPFLFFWQPQSESSEAEARSQRAQAELQKVRISFEVRLSTLTEKSQSLKKQILLLREKLIPRAHKRMRLVENLSARTIEGLDEHRMVMFDYLDLRKKEVDARVDFEKTLAEILKLFGKEAIL